MDVDMDGKFHIHGKPASLADVQQIMVTLKV